jgi:hypothetical protein
MAPNPININYLQTLVTGLREVTGCRIITDAAGEVTEIHVTAVSTRPPRLIARDVDTILKVRGGLDIDHRRIQVALIDPAAVSAPAAPAPPPPGPPPAVPARGELIIEPEPDPVPAIAAPAPTPPVVDPGGTTPDTEAAVEFGEPRVIYEKLTVTHAGGLVTAAVELSRGEQRAVGEREAADTPDGHLAAVIYATLDAMLLLFDTGMHFDAPRFERVPFGREEVLVVHLSAVAERELSSFTGAAVIRQDPRQAAVLATLAATNRLTGLWSAREAVEFDIL